MQRLYESLLRTSEIPVIESSNIHSKGFYLTKDGVKVIYIKSPLSLRGKLLVLLHEYSHHIHLTHYYNQESRAECEIIANGSAYLICQEYGLGIVEDIKLDEYSADTDVVNRLTVTIQSVSDHILSGLKNE